MKKHAKDLDVNIKDLSNTKCHKEMKDACFSIGFIVF
jgi:hypothetical protein